jgi:hypothetical protein
MDTEGISPYKSAAYTGFSELKLAHLLVPRSRWSRVCFVLREIVYILNPFSETLYLVKLARFLKEASRIKQL